MPSHLKSVLRSAALLPVCLTFAALAHAQPVADGFGLADLNRDGYLNYEEFRIRANEYFYTLDRNLDGHLDKQELSSVSPANFRRADGNGDSRILLSEFVPALMQDYFHNADRNRDHRLDRAEAAAAGLASE